MTEDVHVSQELRVLVMREGKLAGELWPIGQSDVPLGVEQHLRSVLTQAGEWLGLVDGDTIEMLRNTFLSAARKSRVLDATRAGIEGQTAERILARMRDGFDAARAKQDQQADADRAEANHRDELRSRVRGPALHIVDRLTADPAGVAAIADVRVLFMEIGRLAGPLWIDTEEGLPPAVNSAVRLLIEALATRVAPDRRFDPARHVFVFVDLEDAKPELLVALREAMEGSRFEYFREFPMGRPLPTGEAEREAEIERRVVARADVVDRVVSAVDEIVVPLYDAHLREGERQIAQVRFEHRAAEKRRKGDRAARGFPQPEPQKYGVSRVGAVLWVAQTLRWLGAVDAHVSDDSNESGVEIVTSQHGVSVKHDRGTVTADEVRAAFGASVAHDRLAMLWTSLPVTEAAAAFAERTGTAIIQYEVETGVLRGLNDLGTGVLVNGLDTAAQLRRAAASEDGER